MNEHEALNVAVLPESLFDNLLEEMTEEAFLCNLFTSNFHTNYSLLFVKPVKLLGTYLRTRTEVFQPRPVLERISFWSGLTVHVHVRYR